MRQQMPTADAKLFDSPEMRKNALENLVRERVLAAVVANEHRGISDEQLLNLINTDPQLAPLRNVETAKQIAAQLDVSHKTVASHREHAVAKLGLRGVADLTRYAIREGLARA